MATPQKTIDLVGVRLAFPDLFVATKVNEDDKRESFKAEFLLQPGPELDKLYQAIVEVGTAQYGPQFADPAWRDQSRMYIPLRDGNTRTNRNTGQPWDGYAGSWVCRAKSYTRPAVFAPDGAGGFREVLAQGAPGCPYSGCYVIATIGIYGAAPKSPTQGVFAGLRAVAFHSDGDAFGAAPVTAAHFAQYANVVQIPEDSSAPSVSFSSASSATPVPTSAPPAAVPAAVPAAIPAAVPGATPPAATPSVAPAAPVAPASAPMAPPTTGTPSTAPPAQPVAATWPPVAPQANPPAQPMTFPGAPPAQDGPLS